MFVKHTIALRKILNKLQMKMYLNIIRTNILISNGGEELHSRTAEPTVRQWIN